MYISDGRKKMLRTLLGIPNGKLYKSEPLAYIYLLYGNDIFNQVPPVHPRNVTHVVCARKTQTDHQPDKLDLIASYKAKIEKELETICGGILKIIQDNLLPNCQTNEPKARIGLHRMTGGVFFWLQTFYSFIVQSTFPLSNETF